MDSETDNFEYEDELPVDEYARRNGLSYDFYSIDAQSLPSSVLPVNDGQALLSATHLLEDDTNLPELNLSVLESMNEQPAISKDSAKLLSTVMCRSEMNVDCDATSCVPNPRSKVLKLELPLLRFDHESDCRRFNAENESQKSIKIDPSVLPQEPLSVMNDEGLEFPLSAHCYMDDLEVAMKGDRIAVSKDTLVYLSRALGNVWTDAETSELVLEQINLQRGPGISEMTLTPPLSPTPQAPEFFVPVPEICQVPLTSDPNTLLDDDLEAAQAALIEQKSSPPCFNTPEDLPTISSPLASPKRRNIESLKVEGPLTPLNSTSSPEKPAIDIQQAASGMLFDHVNHQSETDLLRDDSDQFSSQLIDELQKEAGIAMKIIEQERLEASDAIARIPIPIMDFDIPEAEWKTIGANYRRQYELIKAYHDDRGIPKWPKDRAAEEKLWWTPFPSNLGQLSLEESPDIASDWESAIGFPESKDVPISAACVWKQPGLAILREPDEDEEEELPGSEKQHPKVGTDLESILRKRKFQLDAESPVENISPGSLSSVGLVRVPSRAELNPNQGQPMPPLLLGTNVTNATATLLANYVEFHTSKKQKRASSLFPIKKPPHGSAAASQIPTLKPVKDASGLSTAAIPAEKVHVTPCPALKLENKPSKVIMALNSLGRGIISRLEKLMPCIELIERDFNRWNETAWGPGFVTRSPIVSPLAAEADIIVSPVTGIIITSLIKAIQKPLPGQKGRAAVRERIESVSRRYERLIVLVSEGNRIDESTRELTSSECTAFADLSGFVTGLDTDAQVHYVGGGEDTLTKWLVSFMEHYSPEAAEHHELLIADETTWELFLRRAGMNAYAAQVVLANVRAPDDSQGSTIGDHGLPKIAEMSHADRVLHFSHIMGGSRVLERVSAVLASTWS